MNPFLKSYFALVVLPLIMLLSGCNSDGAFSGDSAPSAPSAFNLHSISPSSEKTLFSWDESEGATEYQLCLKDDTKPDSCDPLAITSSPNAEVSGLGALKSLTSSYFVVAKNAGGSQRSNDKSLSPTEVSLLIQYLKASNSEAVDLLGHSVSLSADGHTLAVGALYEDSNGVGEDSVAQADNSADDSGAVYLFRFADDGWAQEAYLKASNAEAEDGFGHSVSLSADGNTLAVGAPFEASNGVGVSSGADADNSADDSGAVYLFRFADGSWAQEAYLKASNTEALDEFGHVVSLSADGHTLAVGALYEDSNGVGVNSVTQANNSASSSGAVYLFRFTAGSWAQQAYLKASNTEVSDQFGGALSLSSDGSTLAVRALYEDSNGVGVNSVTQANNSANSAGAVYLFRLTGGVWAQQAYIKASNTDANDEFGYSLSLSSDGNTLAVGALNEESNGTGVNSGAQADNSANTAGAVYLFRFTGGVWTQEAYLKASNAGADDMFGGALSLSSDGHSLAVASFEGSNGIGVNPDAQSDNSANSAGAVYLFRLTGGVWAQEAYLKAPNAEADDAFSIAVSLSSDGNTLAVGAIGESSNGVGVNSGAQADNSASYSGAVYLY